MKKGREVCLTEKIELCPGAKLGLSFLDLEFYCLYLGIRGYRLAMKQLFNCCLDGATDFQEPILLCVLDPWFVFSVTWAVPPLAFYRIIALKLWSQIPYTYKLLRILKDFG